MRAGEFLQCQAEFIEAQRTFFCGSKLDAHINLLYTVKIDFFFSFFACRRRMRYDREASFFV